MSCVITVPGRVNLIGEHIDYLGYPVLPMAITRRIRLEFTPRTDRLIRISSMPYGQREFEWIADPPPWPSGDFGNYVKAAAQTVARRWGIGTGFDGSISGNIPPAAGLSSSSALVTAVALALLHLRGITPDFSALMEVLPEGERYVGTRGGAMDHAVCLAGRTGCALRIDFNPVAVHAEPIPPGWAFFVAHSLRRAEKSGAVRDQYNLRRTLAQAGDQDALRHAHSERRRVERAIAAMRSCDHAQFGELLNQSHRSLRDDLRVSCEPADRLVEACLAAGALGARITGAGFGGYVLGFCERHAVAETIERLDRDHFARQTSRAAFRDYLMPVEAGEGALSCVVDADRDAGPDT
jgi:galactokinase